jgi:hypothetical protein
MCIACELGFQIAMDELPDAPPLGFPRRPPRDDADFTCDAPPAATQPAPAAIPAEDERKS